MGRLLISRLNRTAVASLLVATAVSLPLGAWFVYGSRAADHDIERLKQEPVELAGRESARLAQQVSLRLESLRQAESKRSHLDYKTGANKGSGGCDQPQSPLAEGPMDPLVWTHFEIDQLGQLSMPSLAGNNPLLEESRAPLRQAIFEELECASSYGLAALRRFRTPEEERLILTTEGVTTVGPFAWHQVTINQQPALVALREVKTTLAAVTQGFVVLSGALDQLTHGSDYPARIRPGEPDGPGQVLLALDSSNWTVETDVSTLLAEANQQGRTVMIRFWRSFLGGAAAVLLAGGLLVGIVFQSERLARQRSQFAASAAHELRTPLAGLQLYGEMLADGSGDATQQRKYARRIADEVDRLGRVVTNVLGFSRLEHASLTVRPEAGDLASAVEHSISKLSPAIEAKGARLDLETAESLPRTWFDPDALHQILQNLLDNAEKYSRAASDRTIQVAVVPDRKGNTLSVVDHGAGVDPSLRGKLFRPFSRHESPDAPAGLGLGLALVRALAVEQDATVRHADETGGGSRFSVTFQTVS